MDFFQKKISLLCSLTLLLGFLTTQLRTQCLEKTFYQDVLVVTPNETPVKSTTTYCSNLFLAHGICIDNYSFNIIIENLITGFIGKPHIFSPKLTLVTKNRK